MTRSRKANGRSSDGSRNKSKPKATLPQDVPTLIDQANVLIAQSNIEGAIPLLTRATELEPGNLEARELLGVAHLEAGDAETGRLHLLQLLPPHTSQHPSSPSPYMYLAQSAQDPREALGYYSTATAMLEQSFGPLGNGKGKGKANNGLLGEQEEMELRKMAVEGLVAMIEIWMSDLCMEAEAEKNCEDLIAKAMAILPTDPEVRISLASIRMSQQRFDEARQVILEIYREIQSKEPFDPTLPPLPARLQLARLLLEHSLHVEALNLLLTVREEDELQPEGAYLEGWAYHLRAEALLDDPSLQLSMPATMGTENGTGDKEARVEPPDLGALDAEVCFVEALRSLSECESLIEQMGYPDEGIEEHARELLKGLRERGVVIPDEDEDDEAGWEDMNGDGDEAEEEEEGDDDVEMA